MKTAFSIIILVLTTMISGCVKKGCTDPEALNYDAKAQRDDESCNYGDKYEAEKAEYLANYASIAYAMYGDALASAIDLDSAIKKLLANPDADNFSLCQTAWRTAKFQYAKCAALRFAGGPIDGQPNYHELAGTWPIKPRLIDYTANSEGGIVGDESTIEKINESNLTDVNNADNIVTGLHVIEFLLWGEDIDDPEDITVGYRTFQDYDNSDSANSSVARRRTYLNTLGSLLVKHLTIVYTQWSETGAHRVSFLKNDVNSSMKQVLTGIGTLCASEINERMIDQCMLRGTEDNEISAYSDNTTLDLTAVNRGVTAITEGAYTNRNGEKISGPSLVSLAQVYNLELSDKLSEQITLNIEAVENIPTPFDYQIQKEVAFGPGPIAETQAQYEAFEDLLFELAREMEFGLDTELP